MSFGPVEILVVVFVLAMIVGPSRISRVARSLGRSAYDFVDELGSKQNGKNVSGRREQGADPAELESGEDNGEKRRT